MRPAQLSLPRKPVREPRRNFTTCVFVDAAQAHERTEVQEVWPKSCAGVFEALAIGGLLNAHRRAGDHVHVDALVFADRRGPCPGRLVGGHRRLWTQAVELRYLVVRQMA